MSTITAENGVRYRTEDGWHWERIESDYRSKPWLCAYCLGELGVPIPDACPHCGHTMLEPAPSEKQA